MSQSPDVITISFRRPDLLERMLRSVDRHLPHSRIHIWDNHSDGSASIAELAAQWNGVDWYFHESNVGFAAAVNGVMRRVETEQVLLLNPDAVLLSELRASRALLERDPGVAAVAPWLQSSAGHRPWDNAHREPNALRQLVSYAGWEGRLGRHPAVSMLYASQPSEVSGYLTGACLLIASSAWSEVGEFDERYFLYSEEADWCWRARKGGWRLMSVTEPGAQHQAAGTVADNVEAVSSSTMYLRSSQVRYLRDHHGLVAATGYRIGTRLLDATQPAKRRARRRSS